MALEDGSPAAGDEMDRELLLVEYGYGTLEEPYGGRCWCMWPCLSCCCGCLTSPFPLVVRAMDAVVACATWYADAVPGGDFKRHRLDRIYRADDAKADPKGSRTGVASTDVPLAAGEGVFVRVFSKVNGSDEDKAKAPVLFIHGGGWATMTADSRAYHRMCENLARGSGRTVVSVNYRLAPEHVFPAAVHDTYAAMRWLASKPSHPALLGAATANPSRVIIAGDSAGGNLALVLATLVRDGLDSHLNPAEPIPDFAIEKLMLVYPAMMMEKYVKDPRPFKGKPILSGFAMRWYIETYIPGETLEDKRKLAESDRRICPMLAGFENLPPIDIIYGTADGLCPQIELAIPLMRRAGCKVETRVFEGQPHGFLVAVGLPAEKEAAKYIVSRLQ